MRPKIAITTKTEELRKREQTILPAAYAKAIEDAGGIPIIIPIMQNKTNINLVAQVADGFLFSGGGDINPKCYGEEPMLDLELSPDKRTNFELFLLNKVIWLKKPVLGVCLGTQLINVALGGELYQDIPKQIQNPVNHRSVHNISIKDGTLLFSIFEAVKEISVISAHHQAVKSTGNGLDVSAVSPDGVIEAIEMSKYPFLLGVQWHPERDLDDEYSGRLFTAFVKAAEDSRCGRK